MNYADYISVNPNIRFGKPCIIGTRISVYDVLNKKSVSQTAKHFLGYILNYAFTNAGR